MSGERGTAAFNSIYRTLWYTVITNFQSSPKPWIGEILLHSSSCRVGGKFISDSLRPDEIHSILFCEKLLYMLNSNYIAEEDGIGYFPELTVASKF